MRATETYIEQQESIESRQHQTIFLAPKKFSTPVFSPFFCEVPDKRDLSRLAVAH